MSECRSIEECERGLRSRRSWSRVTRVDGQFKIQRHKGTKSGDFANDFQLLLRLTDHESTLPLRVAGVARPQKLSTAVEIFRELTFIVIGSILTAIVRSHPKLAPQKPQDPRVTIFDYY